MEEILDRMSLTPEQREALLGLISDLDLQTTPGGANSIS